MRQAAVALAAALCLSMPATAVESHRDLLPQQTLRLDADSRSSSGWAYITVTKESSGWRMRGYVESLKGCVELKAVNMHLGHYVGGDTVVKTCRDNQQAPVDSFTHHTDVVLTAQESHGMDTDSKIVTLTGQPS